MVRTKFWKLAVISVFLLLVGSGLAANSIGIFKASSGSTAILASSASSTTPTTQNPIFLGDAEDYYTCLTYQSTVVGNPCPESDANASVIDASWTSLIANISESPTDMVYTNSWNTIKVDFAFENMNTSNTSYHYLNLTLLDSVITTIHSAGFNVILDDADYANFASATWVQDWLQVAQHYKGDSEISAFDLFEEPDPAFWARNVTTTDSSSTESVQSAYYNITTAIRAVDPSRTVIWYLDNTTLNPAFTIPNVIYDFHLFANQPDSSAFTTINQAYKFAKKYNVTIGCFELNVGSRTGVNYNQTEAEIAYMKELGIGYTVWGYGTDIKYAIPILLHQYSADWLPTTSYPLALTGQSCVSSGPNSAILLYCVGGVDSSSGTDYNNTYYASLNSGIYKYGVSDPWNSTTSYPQSVGNLECAVVHSGTDYYGTDYCVGGDSNGSPISSVYSANLSSSGIGRWSSQTSYPTSIADTSCFTAAVGSEWADLYCVGGLNSAGASTSATYYTSLMSGSLNWIGGVSYPSAAADGVSCVSAYVNGLYVYCVGGNNSSTYSSQSYYSKLSENGLGTWESTTSYPIPISDASCNIWNATIYCVGGQTTGGSYSNSVYYAPISSSGVGTWKSLTNYPQAITNPSCVSSPYWSTCLGGENSSGSSVASAYSFFLGTKPPPGPLLLDISNNSASVGANITWTSTGWNPSETVTIMAYNPTTKQYIELGQSTTNSSGVATGSFVVPATMVGSAPDHVHAEDATTPRPHTGYITSQVSLTVASSTPPGPLLLDLSSTSGSVGANITWTSTGWNPSETVTIMAFNPTTGQYLILATSVTNSSGIATGRFVVPATMVGTSADQIYGEDASTPFPHTGYQTSQVSFTVTAIA